jgi:broad specificity phosphatase PhoE
MIDFYLIRHAESAYNASGDIVGGRSPKVLLSDRGQAQALKLAEALRDIPFDVAYTSPAARARHTAAIALGGHSMRLPTQWTPALHEMSQGSWEGLPTKEVLTPAVWEAIKADPANWSAPDGESQSQVERRIFNFFEQEIIRRGPGTFALFTHAWVIKCFLRPILCLSYEETFNVGISNASVTHLTYYGGLWLLKRVNDTAHLDD